MNSRSTRPPSSLWHQGETAMQESVGVSEGLAEIGRRIIRSFLSDQHRAFFATLPFVVMGAVDRDGAPWATVRAGMPGFLSSPNSASLHVGNNRDFNDPAEYGMEDGDPIAMLGIDTTTRRRSRLNGSIRRSGTDRFHVVVEQSFGNCPKYIQLREPQFIREPSQPSVATPYWMTRLDQRSLELIRNADTFFVASYVDREDGHREVDVSHRGGKSGFVHVGEGDVLTVPDFFGNTFFNTLGNLRVNPRAGLIFIDFETGDLLQLSGDAEVILDSPEISVFQGAERLWRVTPRRVMYRAAALPLRWVFVEDGWSPHSLMTGSWEGEVSPGSRALTSSATPLAGEHAALQSPRLIGQLPRRPTARRRCRTRVASTGPM